MNRLLACHILFTAFCLIGAAPTAEECKELLKPLPLADHSVMMGKGNLLMGFTDHQAFNAMLEVTEKSEINMTERNGQVVMEEEMKINGTCFNITVKLNVEGDKAIMSSINFTSVYEMLPSCEGCWVIFGNSTGKNLQQMFQFMKLNIQVQEEEITARGIYFYVPDVNAVKDEDRERFLKQANCLGFTGDSNFKYNADKGVCKADELIQMPM